MFRAVAATLVGAVVCLAAAAPGQALAAAGETESGYIVVLRDAQAKAAVTRARAGDLAGRYGAAVSHVYTAGLRGFAARLTERAAARLTADPAVAYVAPDRISRLADTQQNPTWGLDRTDQASLPLSRTYTYPNQAAEVSAYVLDTGIHKAHPDFGGRAVDGYDFIDDDAVANDCHGHGTHVSGTIGSATYGMAKGVRLVGVRVLGCDGSAPNSEIIAGIDWVIQNARQPAVANLSIWSDPDPAFDEAVRRAVSAGITTVVAAGNQNGANACNYTPSRVTQAIVTGATDSSDNRSSFSNTGSCLDVFAPGSSITSTSNSGGTTVMNGTSMASPHVAGAAALYLSGHPGATPDQVSAALTDHATPNVVKNAGSGSPNKLLNISFMNDPTPTCAGGANGDDVQIPDAGAAVTSAITVTDCPGKGSATTNVKVDIAHTYTGDLAIDLIAPSGAAYVLKAAGGVGSAGGVHQTFPVNTTAEDRNGTWRLRVRDVYSYDTGVVDAWSITF
ncbi:S8 family peptidase [Nonomuraea sp. NN258]|nr:S8 family peptidase [Nonomuraea antri]